MWQESHRDWVMRSATLMQGTRESRACAFKNTFYSVNTTYVSMSNPDGANWDTIWINIECSVDMAQ